MTTTTATGIAQRRLVCPAHGFLGAAPACTACKKKPYDIDDPDDRRIVASLREVARSGRMNKARIVCYPLSFIALALVLALLIAIFLTAPLGELLSRGLERFLRAIQSKSFREVDRELLR